MEPSFFGRARAAAEAPASAMPKSLFGQSPPAAAANGQHNGYDAVKKVSPQYVSGAPASVIPRSLFTSYAKKTAMDGPSAAQSQPAQKKTFNPLTEEPFTWDDIQSTYSSEADYKPTPVTSVSSDNTNFKRSIQNDIFMTHPKTKNVNVGVNNNFKSAGKTCTEPKLGSKVVSGSCAETIPIDPALLNNTGMMPKQQLPPQDGLAAPFRDNDASKAANQGTPEIGPESKVSWSHTLMLYNLVLCLREELQESKAEIQTLTSSVNTQIRASETQAIRQITEIGKLKEVTAALKDDNEDLREDIFGLRDEIECIMGELKRTKMDHEVLQTLSKTMSDMRVNVDSYVEMDQIAKARKATADKFFNTLDELDIKSLGELTEIYRSRR